MLDYSAHDVAEGKSLLSQLFDMSLLKYQQRDDVAATFRKYSRKVGWVIAVHVLISEISMLMLWPISLFPYFALCSSFSLLTQNVVHAGFVRHAESLGCSQP